MILTVDLGNTNITLGVFGNGKIVETYRMKTCLDFSASDYESEICSLIQETIEGCVISSVVDELTYVIKQACNSAFGVNSVLLNYNSDLGIGLKTDKPHTIGADRLANCFAASKYPLPAIVVDVGTAVTFDILDQNKNFIGGVIMPGINMELKALADGTSKLEEIKVQESPIAIGNTTETCILSGVVRGTACAIDGLLAQCEAELGQKATVILTGGQSGLVSKYMSVKADYINPNLTLEGLYDFYLKQL